MNTKNKKWERMRRLVEVIGKEAVSRKELMEMLELGQESRRIFYYNYAHPAIEEGLVVMFIPSTPSSPEQAYKLSKRGLEYFESL